MEKRKKRSSLPVNKERDAARKNEKRREERMENEKKEEWPLPPHLSGSIASGGGGGDLKVKFPLDNLKKEMDIGWMRKEISQPSVQGPTYSMNQPLRIRAEFTCYPPPTIVWLKDRKVLARDRIQYVVKEGVNSSSDCKKERLASTDKLRFRVESFYRFKIPATSTSDFNPGHQTGSERFVNERVIQPQLMRQGWSDFIIQEPKLTDEGIYEVRIYNDFGVVEDFIQVEIQID